MKTQKMQFNENERRVLRVLDDRKKHTIGELKKLFLRDATARLVGFYKGWGKKDVDATAQSYVRNALRKLVRLGLCKQVERGTYQRTRKSVIR